MKRDPEFILQPPSATLAFRSPAALSCLFVVVAILAIHHETAASIVTIWIRSETYTHGFLVVPICLWLVWRERAVIAATPIAPWWPGLAFVAAAGALWLLASSADALGLQQFALAFMLQAAVITVVGLRMTRELAFPLVFLLFAVPFGEIFIPRMIDWTADFTVAAVRASGVPVYSEANIIDLPTGRWSVVEACSGVRYLIASLMVGTLYAAIAYRSWRRRAAFIAASIVVPIIANWLRAYLIVMLGHLSNNRLAVGVDHIIYGWIFFGVVMLLLFWVGSFWQQDGTTGTVHAAGAPKLGLPPVSAVRFFVAALAAVAITAAVPPVTAAIARSSPATVPSLPPLLAAGGWSPTAQTITDWTPHFLGQTASLSQSFAKGGRVAGVRIEYYRAQTRGRELITSGNLLVTPANNRWKELWRGAETVHWRGGARNVDRAELAADETRLALLSFYWVDGRVTASPYVGKLLQAWSRLTGRGDDAALVVLYAPHPLHGDDGRAVLDDFASAMLPEVEQLLRAARESGR
jgi:exosortase A